MLPNASPRHYFVDESGDATLFNSRGRVLVGTQGSSNFFILGVLDVPDPDALTRALSDLRQRLLADPYFNNVPSMQVEQGKTAVAFHAKDDAAEVRREVYKLLHDWEGLRFFAVVRDKHKVVAYVRQRNESDPGYRYNPNELYDYMVRRLFRDRLHKDDAYNIYFATRGRSDRTEALLSAVEASRQNLFRRWGIQGTSAIEIRPVAARRHACLQAADYFLWALQRLYEKREIRYLEYLWPAFRLVHDLDDTRAARYGRYYTQKKPLTAAALEDLPGI